MDDIFRKKAFSVVEYMILFVIVAGALYIMKPYLQRGIFGQWQQTGQSFAWGRQYDSQKSIDCSFDQQSNLWYDRNCVLGQCATQDPTCEESIIVAGTCSASSCAQLNS